jgi:hypothetical protein
MKQIIIFFLFLLHMSVFGQTNREYGQLTIYRPKHSFNCAIKAKILVNDSLIKLKNNSVLSMDLKPGKYVIHTKNDKERHEIIISEKSKIYVKVIYTFNFLFGHPDITVVQEDFAIGEINKIKK